MHSFFKKYQHFVVIFFFMGCALIGYSSTLKATSDTSLATRTVLSIYEPPLLAFSFTYTATQADGSQVKGSFTDNYYLDE